MNSLCTAFIDDAQETLNLLTDRGGVLFVAKECPEDKVSDGEVQQDLVTRLQRLIRRMRIRTTSIASHWEYLTEELGKLGMSYLGQFSGVSFEETTTFELPQAFRCQHGDMHLSAIVSLLSCSESEAALLTLSALRSSSTSLNLLSISSLLGTRTLVETVLEFDHLQRITHLQIISECLRIEQSDSNIDHNILEVVLSFLDQLDSTYLLNHGSKKKKKRGLFRFLLASATRSCIPLARSQFESARLLREQAPLTIQTNASFNSIDTSVDGWCHSVMHRYLEWQIKQKVEALEALVVLLYARFEAGVDRCDYTLLLIAFQSAKSFFTNVVTENDPELLFVQDRLVCLASLVLVESTGLWRQVVSTRNTSFAEDHSWVVQHPLLRGIVSGENSNFDDEMDVILGLLERYGSQTLSRRQQVLSGNVSEDVLPQGVALFSTGLLLTNAYKSLLGSQQYGHQDEAYWQTFQQTGLKLTTFANDRCDAFNSLIVAFNFIVQDPHSQRNSTITSLNVIPYELHSFCCDLPLFIESTLRELPAPSLIYSTIGRELLVAIIMTFEDSFFSKHHPNAVSNLEVLSNLAALIFRNSPTLCLSFWEEYRLQVQTRTDFSTKTLDRNDMLPLSRILDSTYSVASLVLATELKRPQKSSDELLHALTPFLTFCSSIVYDAESAEVVMKHFLPKALLRTVLETCASRHMQVDVDLCYVAIAAFTKFSQAGNSTATVRVICDSLESTMSQSSGSLSGPYLLVSILISFAKESRVSSMIFNFLSDLTTNAPESWIMDVVVSLQTSWNFSEVSHCSKQNHLRFFCSLSKRIQDVAFCEDFEESKKISFLAFLDLCANHCVSFLQESLTFITSNRFKEVSGAIPYFLICDALETVSITLHATREISDLHTSSLVRNTANNVCNSVVSNLATKGGIGCAIWYYACFPVILVLSDKLVDFLKDIQLSSSPCNLSGHSSDVKGINLNIIEQPLSQESIIQQARAFLVKAASIEGLVFEFDSLLSKGVIGNEDVSLIFELSLAALQLLHKWAKCVEDIVVKGNSDLTFFSLCCSRHLLASSIAPAAYRQVANFAPVWKASDMNHLNLLLHLLASRGNRLPSSVSLVAFDLLHLSLLHSISTEPYDLSAIRSCSNSRVFASAFNDAIACASATYDSDVLGFVECQALSLSLRCLRVASECIKRYPTGSKFLLGDDPNQSVACLCGMVKGTIDEALRQESIPSVVYADISFLNRMRCACSCLDVVFSLQCHARAFSNIGANAFKHIKAIVNHHRDLLPHLASLVFGQPSLWSIELLTASDMIGHRIMLCLLSLCLDVMNVEIRWILRSESCIICDDHIFAAIDCALDHDLPRFIIFSSTFMALSSAKEYSSQLNCNGSKILLTSLIERKDLFSSDTFQLCHGIYPKLESKHTSGLHVLTNAYEMYAAELRRIRSWQSFTVSLFRFMRKILVEDPEQQLLLSISIGQFSLDMARSLLLNLHDNLISMEESRLISKLSMPDETIAFIARASSQLLVCFSEAIVFERIKSVVYEWWNETTSLVRDCSKKLTYLLGSQIHLGYVALQQLLMCAGVLFSLKPKLIPSLCVRYDNARASLTSACCEVLIGMERVQATTPINCGISMEYQCCFISCLSLLAALITARSDWEDSSYSSIYQLFTDHDLVGCILRHVVALSVDESDPVILSASVKLFTAVASIDEARFSDLIILKAQTLLVRCTATFFAASTGRCLASTDTRSIWIESLTLLSTTMVSSAFNLACTRQRIYDSAIAFFKSNQRIILACLRQCVLHQSDESVSQMYTLPLLREASLVLTISAELCSWGHGIQFKTGCPSMFDEVVSLCMSILGSIGCFLGATASSKELFKVLSDLKTDGQIEGSNVQHDWQLHPLNPTYRLVHANGFANAKHEALRLSSFVARSSKAITEDEMNAQTEFPDHWKPRHQSQSSLERNCRAAVTSKFASEVEVAAAETLFFATLVLWKIHPSSKAFVTFTADEAKNRPELSLINRGTVISFRSKGVVPAFQDANVRYGEVIQTDTFRRQFYVRLIDKKSNDEECIVADDQLAGIEDVLMRRCMLQYSPAPETSAEVEAAVKLSSIGHLLLALRWCCQFNQEINSSISPASSTALPHRTDMIIQRLAEVSTALFGAEISLHRFMGKGHQPKQTQLQSAGREIAVSTLSAQLADLFADTDDRLTVNGESLAADSGIDVSSANHLYVVGRLKGIIHSSVWSKVRVQLHSELDLAREELDSKAQQRGNLQHRGSPRRQYWGGAFSSSSSSRRSGFHSPFRGLGL